MGNQVDRQRAFLLELHELVDEEAAAQYLALNKLYHLPLAQRIAKGRALEKVRIERREDNRLIARFGHNASVYRPGDFVQIGRGDPLMDDRFQVTIEGEGEHHFELEIFHCAVDLKLEDPDGWVIEDSHYDLSDRYRTALNEAGETAVGRDRILPLLMGETEPIIAPERYEHGELLADAAGFNWSQTQAFAEAYACDSAYLIQGPPGTGKTRVLAQLAAQLAHDGERVLITSFTHRAINQALNTVAKHHSGCMAIKVGRTSGADDLRVPHYESFADSPLRQSGRGYIVGSTCFSTQSKRLRDVHFDTVIFDEASQITLPLAIMGMLVANRAIFVGDQKQLPPVLASREGASRPEDSIFGHLSGRGFETMLNTSYRLSPELCEWPSRTFYGGKLKAASEVRASEPAIEFVVVEHEGNTVHAKPEVEEVARLVSDLVRGGVSPAEIGVVAPFRAQGRAIRRRLRQVDPAFSAVVADTVERMQGQERDVVIFSLVSSDVGFLANIAGFYFQPERLNVSITRARIKIYVVGSLAAYGLEPEEYPLREWHRQFLDFLSGLHKSIA